MENTTGTKGKLNKLLSTGKEYIKSLTKKGAVHILAGNFATKFVSFFGSVFLSRLITKTDMGILSYIENLYGYGFVFVGVGMANSLLRFVVLSEEPEKKYAYVQYARKRGLIADLIICAVMITANVFYPHKSSFEVARGLLPIMMLALPFQDLLNQAQLNERAMFANKRFAFFSVGSAAAVVIARVIGAKTGALTGVVIAVLAVNIVLGLGLQFISQRKYFRGLRAETLTHDEKHEAAVYSIQYMITNGLLTFFMLMNIYLLGRLIDDPTVVADYKIAYSFPVNISIFSSAIGIFIAPYFVKNERDKDWVRKNYFRTMGAGFAIIGPVCIVMALLARFLISLYGAQYLNVVPLMRVLIIGSFADAALRYPVTNILAAMGQVRYNMIVAACGFVLQTILNIILIPKLGAYAIAINTIVIHTLMAAALFIVFNKKYEIIRIGSGK